MLSVLENLKETMKKDGHPDRFVNQFEFLNIVLPGGYYMGDHPSEGNEGYDQYGVFWRYPKGQMGAFPVHDEEHKVIKDITEWDKVLTHFPVPPDNPGFWGMLNDWAGRTIPGQQYTAAFYPQGVFERFHALMGMDDAMIALYEEPEACHDLIDFITDAEIDFAKNIMDHVPTINALFHHDDWGSDVNSFLSPDMFDEFIAPAYKKIFAYWRSRGVELVVHHSDSYAANLVPSMIDMGIDIWQGCFPSNNIPELVEKYAGQITFMGEIETRYIDLPDWTQELVGAEVERACRKCKGPSFIPCLTAGGAYSNFPGVYDAVSKEIDRMNSILF